MNFRVFATTDDLRDALVAAVKAAAARALSPHVGIVGPPADSIWILDRFGTRELTFAGYPDVLDEVVRSREDLLRARAEDLHEPLDVVVAFGRPPDSLPPWFGQARGILISPGNIESAGQWGGRADVGAPRVWTFMTENDWQLMDQEGTGSST